MNKNIQTILLFLTAVLMISLLSCNPSKKYEEEERSNIQEYLSSHSNLNFELKPSGLYYLEVVPGSGRQAATHDTAYIKCVGRFLDGKIFDDRGKIDTVIVNEGYLIAGFDEGITYMAEGGKSTLLIPSNLAYGSIGSYPYIPGYSPLLFDVELLKVKPANSK